MPFTLAHPAAVLPLRRIGLPFVALVAGSMAPDVPLFTPWPQVYTFTHSGLGVVTLDPLIALAGVALWTLLLRDALVDMTFADLRRRSAARRRLRGLEWAWAPVGAAVGALTHVVWDAFTHRGRWGPQHIAWLREHHGALTGYHWAQYASGLVGLAVLATYAGWELVRAPRGPVRDQQTALGPPVLLGVVGLSAVAAVSVLAFRSPDGWHDALFDGVVIGTAVLVLGLLVLAGLWHLLPHRDLSV